MKTRLVGPLAVPFLLYASCAAWSTELPDDGVTLRAMDFVADTVEVREFDPTGVRLGRDSMAIRFTGIPEGSRESHLEQIEGGFRYTERTFLTNAMWRTSTVRFDENLRVQHVSWAGEQFGTETGGELEYDGPRVSGIVRTIQDGAPEEIQLDTVLPSGGFDGRALMALLPTLEWTPGVAYSLVLFDSDDASSSRQVLRVVETEMIDVQAGEFLAVRGELSTTQLPVTIWVTRDRPHRVLKMASGNGETVLIR